MSAPTPPLDPLYIAARRVLLDALSALVDHRDAVIIAGAQAIYLRTGSADLDTSVAPYTTDADLVLNPGNLGPEPPIHETMQQAGFQRSSEPGIWTMSQQVNGRDTLVSVDLLVPQAVAGPGRHAARLPPHDRRVARRTPGLEAALTDNSEEPIASLEPHIDTRATRVLVAGVGALLVAKSHKLNDRSADAAHGKAHRLKPKDAGDIIRLMRSSSPVTVGTKLGSLADDPAIGPSVREGVNHLRRLFERPRAQGVDLAVTALDGALPEETVRGFAVAYTRALIDAYGAR